MHWLKLVLALSGSVAASLACGSNAEKATVSCVKGDDGDCSCHWDAPSSQLSPEALAPQCGEPDDGRCCIFTEDTWQPRGEISRSTCICNTLPAGSECESNAFGVSVPTCPPGYLPERSELE